MSFGRGVRARSSTPPGPISTPAIDRCVASPPLLTAKAHGGNTHRSPLSRRDSAGPAIDQALSSAESGPTVIIRAIVPAGTSETSSSRSTSSARATPPPRTGAFQVMSHRARCSLAVALKPTGVAHHVGRSTEQIDDEPHELCDAADRQFPRNRVTPGAEQRGTRGSKRDGARTSDQPGGGKSSTRAAHGRQTRSAANWMPRTPGALGIVGRGACSAK